MTSRPRCKDCGRDHSPYGMLAVAYCDWLVGRYTPGFADMAATAKWFAEIYPDEAAAIEAGRSQPAHDR